MKVSGFGKNLLIFLAADRSSNDCQTFQFNVQFRLLPYSCASFPNVLNTAGSWYNPRQLIP